MYEGAYVFYVMYRDCLNFIKKAVKYKDYTLNYSSVKEINDINFIY